MPSGRCTHRTRPRHSHTASIRPVSRIAGRGRQAHAVRAVVVVPTTPTSGSNRGRYGARGRTTPRPVSMPCVSRGRSTRTTSSGGRCWTAPPITSSVRACTSRPTPAMRGSMPRSRRSGMTTTPTTAGWWTRARCSVGGSVTGNATATRAASCCVAVRCRPSSRT